MKTLTLVLLLAILGCAGAQTQMEMNIQTAEEFEKADKQLNAVYTRLLKLLEKEDRAALKTAQRAWIAWRDAEAAFRADLEARGGSMRPMVYNLACTELTEKRTAQLQALLDEH